MELIRRTKSIKIKKGYYIYSCSTNREGCMKNEELKEIYDEVYEGDKEEFFTSPLDLIYSETYKAIRNHINKSKVLDLGCGDGSFLNRYVTLEEPSEIHGYDYSETGIQKAKEHELAILRKIYYRQVSFEDLKFELEENLSLDKETFDVITSIGVIEHLDDPSILFYIANKLLKPGGLFVLEFPNFLNLRGVIWKALEVFVGAEMSKTDKQMILPSMIFENMNYFNFECETIITFDHERGMYAGMVDDFSTRLKLALDGKVDNLNSKIQEFFSFLKFVNNDRIFTFGSANGAEILYKFRKK